MAFISVLISRIKIIALGSLAITAIVSPFFITNIFEKKTDNFLFREFKFAETAEGAEAKKIKNFNEFDLIQIPHYELIKGTKKYNDGNYVMYFGSEKCPFCNLMLYGSITKDDSEDLQELMQGGSLYSAHQFVKNNEVQEIKKLKFLFFSDSIPSQDERNNSDLEVLPWSKWDETNLKGGKISGEYKRNDNSAIKFREILDWLTYSFADRGNVSSIPRVVVYKDAQPFIFGIDHFNENKDYKSVWSQLEEKEKSIQAADSDFASNKINITKLKLIFYIDFLFTSKITEL